MTDPKDTGDSPILDSDLYEYHREYLSQINQLNVTLSRLRRTIANELVTEIHQLTKEIYQVMPNIVKLYKALPWYTRAWYRLCLWAANLKFW